MTCHDIRPMLGAYADRELPSADAAAIGLHVEGCAGCRERLAALESLGRLVRSVPYYSAPDRLRTKAASVQGRARFPIARLAWAAAITLGVLVSGAAGIRARQTARATSALAEDVVNRHVNALMGDHVFDVRSSNQHTVKPWFQGKLSFSPPVPDLTAAGFPLIGGRVDAVSGRPAGALIYQRREHVITVFIWPGIDRASPDDARTIRGFQERHWNHADLSLWAVSDLNDRELREFAQAFESSSR